jgi:hydrogenase nickel incorporation protein HypA/HybF
MHELSIAVSIVETVEENLPTAETRVKSVLLKIGKLSGVVKDALEFSFDIATQDSNLTGAKLEIEELPVIVHCRKCDQNLELGNPPIFRCTTCGEVTPDIVQGKELEIVSIELAD